MDNLGLPVKDIITGFEGVIITKAYHITGCIIYGVRSKVKDNESVITYFDPTRLVVTGKRVMKPVIDFKLGTETAIKKENPFDDL